MVTSNEPSSLWHGAVDPSTSESLSDFARARFLHRYANLERIYSSADTLEHLAEKAFGITQADRSGLEEVAGTSVTRYPKGNRPDVSELSSLLNLPIDGLIALLVDSGKAHSTIYKKGYWGDRRVELIAHALEIHPQEITQAASEVNTPEEWFVDTAWRVVSTAVGFVFGHITPRQFFCPLREALPDDVFCINRTGGVGAGPEYPPSRAIFSMDQQGDSDFVREIGVSLDSMFESPVVDEVVRVLGGNTTDLHGLISQKFFRWHLSNYSDYRRQAPIYWPLSTESGSYTLWIYYHRLTNETLFSCVNDFIEPKIRDVSRDVERLHSELAVGGTSKQRDALDRQQTLHDELSVMRDELLRVADLPFNPNLNDGVIINAAPLWQLFSHKPWQKACKACWEKLEAGDYDWAHMAHNIWPDRVREKCRTDKSLAIAHDLEELYEEPPEKPKKRGRKMSKAKQIEVDL